MKKIVLFLLPLLLLSCNNTKENEPKEPEKEVQKYYELWFYPSRYHDLTLDFWISRKTTTILASEKYEPVKISVPINKENIHIYGQSKYYEIRGMKENEYYRIECNDEIPDIVEEQVESIDIDIKCISSYK